MSDGELRSIEDVLNTHVSMLMDLPHVLGAGVGDEGGKRVIKVFVDCPPDQAVGIPKSLEAFEVVAEQRGQATALGS